MSNNDVSEIPRYKKRSKSSISKSEQKAKHKHKYKDCLLVCEGHPYKAHYCTICGKVRDWDICTEKCEYGYRQLFDKEIFEEYNDLEQIEVENLWIQHIQVS